MTQGCHALGAGSMQPWPAQPANRAAHLVANGDAVLLFGVNQVAHPRLQQAVESRTGDIGRQGAPLPDMPRAACAPALLIDSMAGGSTCASPPYTSCSVRPAPRWCTPEPRKALLTDSMSGVTEGFSPLSTSAVWVSTLKPTMWRRAAAAERQGRQGQQVCGGNGTT